MKLDSPRILVVGDIMLDVLSRGAVERLSPEAPVPVLLNPSAEATLGGAANTAANAAALGAVVTLVGAVGDDLAGETVRKLLAARAITAELVSVAVPTTTKTRFVAGSQHLLRVDNEQRSGGPEVFSASQHVLAPLIASADAIIVADYDKGFVSPRLASDLITSASVRSIPVIVDTKSRELAHFRGASVLTPNSVEARLSTGLADSSLAAQAIQDVTRGNVVLTLGADGMCVLDGGRITNIGSHAIDVADVTGAGDTVAAAVAVALLAGLDLVESARWASRAAAIAVAHIGTHAVSRDEFDDVQTQGA